MSGHAVSLRVLFYQPQIPPNTGNAIRLVAAAGCELHLVRPLGFDLSHAQLKRAGLDYHDLASVTVHDDLASVWRRLAPTQVVAFTADSDSAYTDIAYAPDAVLAFGPEPGGLPETFLQDARVTDRVRIPMRAGLRSLNLSNSAAVAVYEALRQHGFASLQ